MTAAAATERIRQVWSASIDYQPIATREVLISELLARAADVHSGERVLDVGAGTGNTALAAARRGARVTATDFAPAMLAMATRRAEVEGLPLQVEIADVQELPFPDGSFDVVLSTFGAMYAPDQRRTAAELIRVCRPGGRIGLASWTPDGLVGRLQAAGAGQPGAPEVPPAMWGTEAHCRELFGNGISELRSTVRTHEFCAASAHDQVEFLRRHLPPWHAAFEQLDPASRERAMAAATAAFEQANRATDGTLVARADYLEVIATVVPRDAH